MAGTILTPTAIWKNFEGQTAFEVEVLNQKNYGATLEQSFLLKGRTVQDGAVKIFCEFTWNTENQSSPAILLLQDFGAQFDHQLVCDLVNRGYSVLCVDLAGYKENKENYTIYPESLSYANFVEVKDNLYTVDNDVTKTCWYEWTHVARTALGYLKSLPQVSKVGCFGIGEAATVTWQIAGTDQNLDSAVVAFNAGWTGYRGLQKFSTEKEPQFSDSMYKFIAGIDAQSYAMHVKCPVLILSATNNNVYDFDRAFDTLSYIGESIYSAVHYSVGSIDEISGSGYRNARIFFERTLIKADEAHFPTDMEVKNQIQDGKFEFEVKADQTGLKSVELYLSEQEICSSKRSWHKLDFKKVVENNYFFDYAPFPTSNIITFFAVANYQDGLSVGSNVMSVRYDSKDVCPLYKSNVIYSSREIGAENTFFSVSQDLSFSKIAIADKTAVSVKKGPMGILGITGESELSTFKVGIDKYRLPDGSMLMFDVYAKEKSQITVKLTCDYFGEKREYSAKIPLVGGQVWSNIQLEMNKFKTEEGMALKSYEKVEALSFKVEDSEYLINNVLWV